MHRLWTQCLKISCVSLLACAGAVAQSPPAARRTAVPPRESANLLETQAGFLTRLLAHEPTVVDPVDVSFDDRGRMWVVEMRDYPFRIGESPRGRIRVLEDADGDAVYEQATVFADALEMPTSLALWKDGVVVTLAGQLVFLRDSDQDLVADEQQVWLEGFAEENEQLRANHPRLRPDGTWYIANGLRGGEVRVGSHFRGDSSPEPLKIGSRDIVFDPAQAAIRLVTGPAQFGLCFDTRGNRYFCTNRNPAVKVVFEQEDLLGNPLGGILPSVVDVLPAGEASRVLPLVDAWTTSNLHAGQFTAACGVFVRELAATESNTSGAVDNFTAELLACEPTGSLVKRTLAVVHAAGSQLLPDANPAQEWLASRDAWFRPVNINHAPDGGLVIVDMHRAVIEHPQWVPEELKNRPDERWGDDCGRVWWVGQSGGNGLARVLAELKTHPLAERSTDQLVSLVGDANPWFRETATRLLVERGATSQTTQALVAQAHSAQVSVLGRIASLSLAAGMASGGELIDWRPFLEGAQPAPLRVAALRLLRQQVAAGSVPPAALLPLVASRQEDLRFEALLCLGAIAAEKPEMVPVGHELLADAVRDSSAYQMVAATSALRAVPGRLLVAWLQALQSEDRSDSLDQFEALARGLAVSALQADELPAADFRGMAEIALTSEASTAQVVAMVAMSEVAKREAALAKTIMDDAFWDRIGRMAADFGLPAAVQRQAVELLGRSPRGHDAQLLGQLVASTEEPQAKQMLLTAWATIGGEQCDAYLVEALTRGSPSLQATILQLLGQRDSRIEQLGQELAAGRLTAQQIGATALKSLVTRAKQPVKSQLQQALDQLVNSDRATVVANYQDCLKLEADPLRGRQVFKLQCASCHRIADVGVQVGPDISDSRTQQPLQLLTAILHPNLAIDNNYFRFVVLTKNDDIVEGMVAEETADAIVIRGQENKRTVIPRSEIADLKPTGVSMMPEGLESQIDQQAMADLIAFIKGWRYLDGAIPGK